MLAEFDVYNVVSSASTKLLGAMYVLPKTKCFITTTWKSNLSNS